MKFICIFLAFASTSSCFCAEAVDDFLQDDDYWHPSDYKNKFWFNRLDSQVDVTEDKACEQEITDEGTVNFSLNNISSAEVCNILKWYVPPVSGYDMDVTINYLDLDEAAGDFLIISPGPSLVRDEASVVLTGIINTTKLIRVMDHNEITLLLVIQERITNESRKDGGFHLSYKASGETTLQPPTTTPNTTLPTAPSHIDSDISIYFYSTKILPFKDVVAKMATNYCESKDISTQNSTTRENVRLSLITECPRTWPNWETCTKVNMTVPVHVINADAYELTRRSLEEMWNMYANTMLPNISLSVYQVPDIEETLHLWLYIFLGVAAIFTLLMVTAWRLNLLNISNKKGTTMHYGPFENVSIASTDSWISNSYQEVPPMTDFYHDTYDKAPVNQNITTSPNTLTVPCDEKPKLSDEFGAAFYFQNRVSNIGYDNPSFNLSSEQHNHKDADIIDDFSSDDESASGANTSKDIKPNYDHLYEAPKKVTYDDNKNESAL
ncbi:uncharacterized protein LOC111863265 isoform X2 [Cryptotermes secundus]|uniref:uncharacterized protein LOC111863265 isoform X2 n=1 Tax=Cryptotermes secundus TaxID=105785 RepID=UPI000CD7B4F8|nr:uncharacterized protein LOC111863265 isoform X2 [Cryptotermes secundus]